MVARGLTRLATLLLSVGCTAPEAPLRLALNPWPGYEAMFLAESRGFYAAEGVEVRLVEFSSLSDARRALERGQVDGLASTVVEVLQARQVATDDPVIVRVFDYSSGGDKIITHSDCPDVPSLRGRKVGLEYASVGVFILARALERAGLSLADVSLVSADQLTLKQRFEEGELCAIVTYPPTSVSVQRLPGTRLAFSSAEIPGEVLDVLSFHRSVLSRRPKDVAKVLRAHDRAVDFLRREPQVAIALMAARERISADDFATSIQVDMKLVPAEEQAPFFEVGGRLTAVIDATDRVLRHTGQLDGPDRRAGTTTDEFLEVNRK